MKSHRRSFLQFILVTLFVSTGVLAFAPSAQVQQNAQVTTTTRGGLQTVTFDTIDGKVIVNLTDDIMAGDTISGTVIVETKRQTQPEVDKGVEDRSLSMELLFDSFKTVKVPTISGARETFTLKIPAGAGSDKVGGQMKLTLKGNDGSPIQTTNVPFAPPFGSILTSSGNIASPPGVVNAENSNSGNRFTLTEYTFPNMGQQGRPVEIHGPFDGSFENTKVAVGGQEIPILAASPRKAVFKSPTNVTGPTEIVLSEGGKETRGEFRNIGVKLSAPRTTLLKGESTTLMIQAFGLHGIKAPVPLHLTKGGVVTMQGGDSQTMSIKPAEVQGNGTFTATRTITGVQPGSWNATATVVIFDGCLQDENNGNQLSFSSGTGDFIFCQLNPKTGGSTALVRNDGVMDAFGGNLSDPGLDTGHYDDVVRKTGAILAGDFHFRDGDIHLHVDTYAHSGNATVQTSNPNRTFNITDRDTSNNTCACPGPGEVQADQPGQPPPSDGKKEGSTEPSRTELVELQLPGGVTPPKKPRERTITTPSADSSFSVPLDQQCGFYEEKFLAAVWTGWRVVIKGEVSTPMGRPTEIIAWETEIYSVYEGTGKCTLKKGHVGDHQPPKRLMRGKSAPVTRADSVASGEKRKPPPDYDLPKIEDVVKKWQANNNPKEK